MKRIISFILAITISITIISNNCLKAEASASAGALAYLIQACAELLIGSGIATQSQINNMSPGDIIRTTRSSLPSIDLSSSPSMKGNFITNFNNFINESILGLTVDAEINAMSKLITDDFVKFIYTHVQDLGTVNPDLKGFGAVCTVKNSLGDLTVYFGDYGIISKAGNTADIYGYKIVRQYTDNYHGYDTTETHHSGSLSCGQGLLYETTFGKIDTKFVGDWRYPDGSAATDMLTFSDEVPEAIGSVDVDGVTHDVNGDGTVNVDDRSYTINDDGTVIINDNKYYPVYDVSPYSDSSIEDLLDDVLEDVEEEVEDLDEVAEEIENSELSSLMLPKSITSVFPFCIPWDFAYGIELLSEKPQAPRFEVPFELPQYGSFPGFKKMVVIDFSEYSKYFDVVRWTTFILFLFGLCFLTFKIVKGA